MIDLVNVVSDELGAGIIRAGVEARGKIRFFKVCSGLRLVDNLSVCMEKI